MNLTYFKRYRMEIDLPGRDFSPSAPPQGYRFIPWEGSLLDAYAEAKYRSFRDEIDANVFPCLGELAGCRRLMTEISEKPGFLPEATWLAEHLPNGAARPVYCGTVQGVRNRDGIGAIQNLGIAPGHRDFGLGTRLLFCSLKGFRQAGLKRVTLEVTAQNDGAIRLYRRLGFSLVKTVFKAVDGVYA
ncbi:MAG TPA: GNAT family N-acetyltransferase [Thermoguttaceae bacterium]|nr:GNAT family N-acetyltransferase [Thermoguttaceae bacterium]